MPDTVEIQMPQMGESVTEGTVLEWHKQEGEYVEEGETVVEVSTDKVDAEVPSPASGVITKILKGPDETIEVGGILAELDPSAQASTDGGGSDPETGPGLTEDPTEEGDADLGETGAGDEVAGGVVQIVMPEMGESVTEGTILEWHKQEGEAVAEGDTVVEVSTDKVDAEVPAPAGGTIARILAQPDETVQVGQVLAELEAGSLAATPAEASAQASEEAVAPQA